VNFVISMMRPRAGLIDVVGKSHYVFGMNGVRVLVQTD